MEFSLTAAAAAAPLGLGGGAEVAHISGSKRINTLFVTIV